MTAPRPPSRFTFGAFELDSGTGELRRGGLRVKLHSQPFQVLVMLLERPGEMLTREEICRELWPDGTYVDYEHGVNSAVNRLREALGDKARNPRFVETLARRGYRFVAPVQRIMPEPGPPSPVEEPIPGLLDNVLATPQDLPRSSRKLVLTLFVLLQLMYLGFYTGVLANIPALNELLAGTRLAEWISGTVISTAALLIPVRAFLLCAAMFQAPGLRGKFLRIWPILLVLDALWSLAPFLLRHMNYGLALACTTLLVYSPFAQRSLILMGAAGRDQGNV